MRIGVMSDLHVEFHNHWIFPLEAMAAKKPDLVILAGDVSDRPGTALTFARHVQRTCECEVLMIAGNHEFYCGIPYDDLLADARERVSKSEAIYFLENDSVEISGIQFFGATLWTDFELFPDIYPSYAMADAARGMNDFYLGRMKNAKTGKLERLSPAFVRARHHESVEAIETFINGLQNEKAVIITHHLPSLRSVAEKWRSSSLSAAFASNLNDLVERAGTRGARLWVHGHAHESSDYFIGQTRVICNPFGYFNDDINPGFIADFVIEI